MNPLSYFYGFKGKELDDHTVDELRAIATRYQIPRRTRLRKNELVRAISRNLRYQKSAHAKSTVGWKIEAERDKIRRGDIDPLDLKVRRPEPESDLEISYTEERETIGERIRRRALLERKTDADWYANELFTELSDYSSEPMIGSLCFFSYSAAYPEKHPFYDTRPLSYILGVTEDLIVGANLHYLNPGLRGAVASSIINKRQVDFSIGPLQKTIHSYLPSNMGELFAVPVDRKEWVDVSELVTEKFIDPKGIYVEPQTAWDSI